MKKINEIYSSSKTPYVSKAIVSSNLIEIEQRNQIISEIRNLRKSVEELQVKDTEKKQELMPLKKERLEIPSAGPSRKTFLSFLEEFLAARAKSKL